MKNLDAFQQGDGAHCGLSDWYESGEAQLRAAVAEHAPFDTGWYSSKKEIASARIWSEDGAKIKVEVSVSDDFDTEGLGYASTNEWTLDAVQACIASAWDKAERSREDNEEYAGFSVHDHANNGVWEETYLLNIGYAERTTPPGDNYYWWGWQYDGSDDGDSVPHPSIPAETVKAFEKWAQQWAYGQTDKQSLRIGDWEIKPWRKAPPTPEDPSDYTGMGWVGKDGRP